MECGGGPCSGGIAVLTADPLTQVVPKPVKLLAEFKRTIERITTKALLYAWLHWLTVVEVKAKTAYAAIQVKDVVKLGSSEHTSVLLRWMPLPLPSLRKLTQRRPGMCAWMCSLQLTLRLWNTTTTIFEFISRGPIFHFWGTPGCRTNCTQIQKIFWQLWLWFCLGRPCQKSRCVGMDDCMMVRIKSTLLEQLMILSGRSYLHHSFCRDMVKSSMDPRPVNERVSCSVYCY